jgi:hypothetical protein
MPVNRPAASFSIVPPGGLAVVSSIAAAFSAAVVR